MGNKVLPLENEWQIKVSLFSLNHFESIELKLEMISGCSFKLYLDDSASVLRAKFVEIDVHLLLNKELTCMETIEEEQFWSAHQISTIALCKNVNNFKYTRFIFLINSFTRISAKY